MNLIVALLLLLEGRRAIRMALAAIVCLAIIGTNLTPRAFGRSQPANNPRRDPLRAFDTTGLTIQRKQIRSGGPRKDGIPSLTDPKTVPVKEAQYQAKGRVVIVTVNKVTRGYPIAILNWHEAINDVLGKVPIAVIYCPLCDSVSVVDRRMEGQTLEFGISGLLHNSNVILYDRKSNALWSQIGLKAVSGPHVGKSLKHLPWQLARYADFRRQYPDATVVSTNTGHRRDYERNPYQAYFATDQLMFPVARRDDRLKPKTIVVGMRLGEVVRAYPVEAIRQADGGTISEDLGDSQIVLKAYRNGGVAVVNAPKDAMVVHTFWFAWAAFHPGTSVYGQKATRQQPAASQPHSRPSRKPRRSIGPRADEAGQRRLTTTLRPPVLPELRFDRDCGP